MNQGILEICVDNIASVEACAAAGVHRIELCSGLVEGGTTPSAGFLKVARGLYGGRIMMMIRPRSGDFIVSTQELDIMRTDIDMARAHGADGVVFGCLHPDGRIDERVLSILMDSAAGMDVTFHRAFDVSVSLTASLETLIRHGVPRVLTSGGMPCVAQGAGPLAALHMQSSGRITLLAGGGLNASLLPGLRAAGLREFHLSGRRSAESPMEFRRTDIPMGATEVPGEYIRRQADPAMLRDLLNAIRG